MIASIVLVLYFMGALSLETAIVCLYISGLLLIAAEFAVVSLGLLTVNAILALYAGFALQSGQTMIMGVDVGWGFLFGIAFIEFALLFVGLWLWRKHQRISPATGTDSMIGKKAEVIEWNQNTGKISYEGEAWKAKSEKELDLNPKDFVTIEKIDKLTIIVTP